MEEIKAIPLETRTALTPGPHRHCEMTFVGISYTWPCAVQNLVRGLETCHCIAHNWDDWGIQLSLYY